jgi:hypothetical protein
MIRPGTPSNCSNRFRPGNLPTNGGARPLRRHAGAPIRMTSDLGIILHSAAMWLELHGENAIAEARRMAAEMQAKGDKVGADTWLQIIVAIGELQRNTTARPS